MMKLKTTLALLPLLALQLHAEAPLLAKTVGIGAGIGAQRYHGTFGDKGSAHVRGFLAYHPTEWLGTRVTGGYGGLTNDNQMGVSYKTEWFSDLGMDLVLQPQMGLGPLRPFLASGVSSTFGTSMINGVKNHDLDWNYYVPVEVGVEYLVANNLTLWMSGETYAYMKDGDKLDGVRSAGDYFESRDAWQKVGVGFTFLIGSKGDADADGIKDGTDQCPGTPKDLIVDTRGCPLDGDKDGVPDFKDVCRTTPSGSAVDAIGCTFDTDKDGVLDEEDKCPNTPMADKVDDRGCTLGAVDADRDGISDATDKCPGSAAGSKVDNVGCALDSDKDGVGDDIDLCANTLAGSKVDDKGCVLPLADADRDGISDGLDKCPGTRAGVKVDSNGCTLIILTSGTRLIMDGIVFKTGSAEIDEANSPVLGRAAVALSNAPNAKIEIAGFTDNVGSESSNQRLSERRAASVRSFLLKSGVPSAQLTVRGYGESEPVVDNTSAESRAENRRIEFRVK